MGPSAGARKCCFAFSAPIEIPPKKNATCEKRITRMMRIDRSRTSRGSSPSRSGPIHGAAIHSAPRRSVSTPPMTQTSALKLRQAAASSPR